MALAVRARRRRDDPPRDAAGREPDGPLAEICSAPGRSASRTVLVITGDPSQRGDRRRIDRRLPDRQRRPRQGDSRLERRPGLCRQSDRTTRRTSRSASPSTPTSPDLDREVERFRRKVENGADFAMTQVFFDWRLLGAVSRPLRRDAADPGARRRLAAHEPQAGAADPSRGARASSFRTKCCAASNGPAIARARGGLRDRAGDPRRIASARAGRLRHRAVQESRERARPASEPRGPRPRRRDAGARRRDRRGRSPDFRGRSSRDSASRPRPGRRARGRRRRACDLVGAASLDQTTRRGSSEIRRRAAGADQAVAPARRNSSAESRGRIPQVPVGSTCSQCAAMLMTVRTASSCADASCEGLRALEPVVSVRLDDRPRALRPVAQQQLEDRRRAPRVRRRAGPAQELGDRALPVRPGRRAAARRPARRRRSRARGRSRASGSARRREAGRSARRCPWPRTYSRFVACGQDPQGPWRPQHPRATLENAVQERSKSRTPRGIVRRFQADTGTLHWLEDGVLVLKGQVGIPPHVVEIVQRVPVGKGMAGPRRRAQRPGFGLQHPDRHERRRPARARDRPASTARSSSRSATRRDRPRQPSGSASIASTTTRRRRPRSF